MKKYIKLNLGGIFLTLMTVIIFSTNAFSDNKSLNPQEKADIVLNYCAEKWPLLSLKMENHFCRNVLDLTSETLDSMACGEDWLTTLENGNSTTVFSAEDIDFANCLNKNESINTERLSKIYDENQVEILSK